MPRRPSPLLIAKAQRTGAEARLADLCCRRNLSDAERDSLAEEAAIRIADLTAKITALQNVSKR